MPAPIPTSAGPTPKPTLKTIARMTGLGVTTVSKALKDAPDIGAETKQRVRMTAEQIGYRPNRAGLRLRTGKTYVIALILDTEEEIMGLTTDLISGITNGLRGTPYHLAVIPYSHDQDPMEPVRQVAETGMADAIILSRTEPRDPRVRYLAEKQIPFTTHGRTELGIAHAFHDFDNSAFGREAVDRLVCVGRTRIALIGAPSGLTYETHLREGFLEGLSSHGLAPMPSGSVTTDSRIQEVAAQVRSLLASCAPPNGFVAASAGAGIGVVYGAEQEGLALGQDFDVVAKQTAIDLLRWVRPGFQVVNEDFKAAGEDLAQQVLKLIEGTPPETLQTIAYPGHQT
ncbi:LacI family transcriptional regulator [Roseibium sp. RKSG952]|uniref:LacI family transcriptional regulator n=1 Tax=Roseibium sp. RKSG952 TaxID=2529384 RepID=UPI0012BC82D4|nr:LacI family transcriptional regulator [Roseibium sp. RKSG952]MTI00373.1 LacI family DNA-binding transcriptional regulator [Roseibium sp. RKSG952]